MAPQTRALAEEAGQCVRSVAGEKARDPSSLARHARARRGLVGAGTRYIGHQHKTQSSRMRCRQFVIEMAGEDASLAHMPNERGVPMNEVRPMAGTRTIFPWDDQAESVLRDLWPKGFSASQIAKQLARGALRPSRNAVIGKVYRLGLGKRATTERSKPAPRRRVKSFNPAPPPQRSSKPILLRPAVQPPANPDIVEAILALGPRQCRWPLGEPVTHFCCAEAPLGEPYCPYHAYVSERGLPASEKAIPTLEQEREAIVELLLARSLPNTVHLSGISQRLNCSAYVAERAMNRVRAWLKEEYGVSVQSERGRGFWLAAADRVRAAQIGQAKAA